MTSNDYERDPYDTTGVYRLTERERIRLGLVKAPKKARTLKIVYPVHVSSRAMYYQTVMIPRDELDVWKARCPGLEVISTGGKNRG